MTNEEITIAINEISDEKKLYPIYTRRAKNRKFLAKQKKMTDAELWRTRHGCKFPRVMDVGEKLKPLYWRRYYPGIAWFKRKANKAVRRYRMFDDEGMEIPMISGKQYRKVYDYAWTIA